MVVHSCSIQAGVFVFVFRALVLAAREFELSSCAPERKASTVDVLARKCAEWIDFCQRAGLEGEDGMDWPGVWSYIHTRLGRLQSPRTDKQVRELATLLYRRLRDVPMQRPGIVTAAQVEARLRKAVRSQLAAGVALGAELFWAQPKRRSARRRSSQVGPDRLPMLFIRRAEIATKIRGLFGLGIFGETYHSRPQLPPELQDDGPIVDCLSGGGVPIVVFWTPASHIPAEMRREMADYALFEFGLCHEAGAHAAAPRGGAAAFATGTWWHGWLTVALLCHLAEDARTTGFAVDAIRAAIYGEALKVDDAGLVAQWFGVTATERLPDDVAGWLEAQACTRGRCAMHCQCAQAEGDAVLLPCPSPAKVLISCTRMRLSCEHREMVGFWTDRARDLILSQEFVLASYHCEHWGKEQNKEYLGDLRTLLQLSRGLR